METVIITVIIILSIIIAALAVVVAVLLENKKQLEELKKNQNALKLSFEESKTDLIKTQGTFQRDLDYCKYKEENLESSLLKQIEVLKTKLSHIEEENKRYKKVIDNYISIEEDSKKLNYTENWDSEANSGIDHYNNQQGQVEEPFGRENNIEKNVIHPHTVDKKELDDDQNAAYELMSNSKVNAFITGKAGTGKSLLLRNFVAGNSNKKMLLLAPTGVAAINIGGVTIHSAFGYDNLVRISIDELRSGKIKLNENKRRLLESVETILIDEVSMVRADVFEKIDVILRKISNQNEPFGGKQMILFGDLFQLPPIANGEENRFLTDKFGGVYFFDAFGYKNGNFKFKELTINHRQKDDAIFFELLNRIREGCVSNKDLEELNGRVIDSPELLSRTVIRLFSKKTDAEQVNNEELLKIPAPAFVYEAEIDYLRKDLSNKALESTFPVVQSLTLKVGATVMLVSNDVEGRWVNGTLGIVSSLSRDCVKVRIQGREYEIQKAEFVEREAVYENGKIEYRDVSKIYQYPIILAYAITIHKSQGMTYQQVACDISDCFAPGQAYVAISRCGSLKGLHLMKKVDESSLKVEDRVREFYLKNI